MSVLIVSGPARVVGSGIATTFGGNPLVLLLQLPEDNFVVELTFRTDPEAPGVAVHPEHTDVGLRLACVNFDDAEGRGSAMPVLLGELDEDLVFFHFRVFRWGQTPDRSVHYTFYRASKEELGWQATGPGGG